ncbi:MAG: hypothetical protein EOO46_16125 [Flavobacterium sp.]|nr:MAG: hypothetical protein EOO46_16125 [Flavobacterium sp.]
MKKISTRFLTFFATFLLIASCNKTDDTTVEINTITLSSSATTVELGNSITFSVIMNTDTDVTSDAVFYVNDAAIEGNTFSPTTDGTFTVVAKYVINSETLTSNSITINATTNVTQVTIFDKVVFYDGYAATVNNPVQAGTIRKSNASYVTKLTAPQIASLSNKLKLQVTIGALCDNYDRIGGVFVNMVNKGNDFTVDNVTKRLEVGRFITPFMNKNKNPTEVDYIFDTDNLALLFNDPAINDLYDFWIELNVFGVPYAANTQVAGCSGRNDVFEGTLKFISTNETYDHTNQLFVPIVTYTELKKYDASGTDIVGQTVRTYNFNVPSNITNAKLYVITSNHGANENGEEYNRREHFIYFDGALVDTYIPGGKSCEPYRIYNTQGNGIYGSSPRSLATWLSFSNWCPGDIIPIRAYDLPNLNQGNHSFKIEVPDAVFANNEGYFPVSVYIQGDL